MPEHPPAVGRVASVFNLFVSEPDRPWHLSQIANRLSISRATCHAVLTSLVQENYLYRTREKSYLAGWGLKSLLNEASRYTPLLSLARTELSALSAELGVSAATVYQQGSEWVMGEHVTPNEKLSLRRRRANMSAHGAAFLAMLRDIVFDGGFYVETPKLTAQERVAVYAQLQFLQRNGFAIGRAPDCDDEPKFPTAPARLDEEPLRADYLLAPIVNIRGQVTCVVVLSDLPQTLSEAEVLEMGGQLRESCARISDALRSQSGQTDWFGRV